MGLVSVSGFGDVKPMEDIKIDKSKVFEASNLDSTLLDEPSGLVKFEAINRKFSLGKLLRGAGFNPDTQTMYCPFHDDRLTGKPSAKYHSDTDKLYCFSESKMYTAYHALKIIYAQDMNKVFNSVWTSMSKAERQEILDMFSEDGPKDVSNQEPSIWDTYAPVLNSFRDKKVNYTQFKNGIYRVFYKMYEDNRESEEKS
jgi:hypothetical protein